MWSKHKGFLCKNQKVWTLLFDFDTLSVQRPSRKIYITVYSLLSSLDWFPCALPENIHIQVWEVSESMKLNCKLGVHTSKLLCYGWNQSNFLCVSGWGGGQVWIFSRRTHPTSNCSFHTFWFTFWCFEGSLQLIMKLWNIPQVQPLDQLHV